MMTFEVKTNAEFDVDGDLSERVLQFVTSDMWYDHPSEQDYDALSNEQTRELIIAILETALKNYKNT